MTGGVQVVGRAIVERPAERGHVVLVDRSEPALAARDVLRAEP